MQVLFGGNVCENERIGSRRDWGNKIEVNFSPNDQIMCHCTILIISVTLLQVIRNNGFEVVHSTCYFSKKSNAKYNVVNNW